MVKASLHNIWAKEVELRLGGTMSDSLAIVIILIGVILGIGIFLTALKIIDKNGYARPAELKADWLIVAAIVPLAVVVITLYLQKQSTVAIFIAMVGFIGLLVNHERFVTIWTLERQQNQKQRKREIKPDRNSPCPCGSGLKYKHCCGKNSGTFRG